MALPQLTEAQIATWTRQQKDRWWCDNVYRGVVPRLTCRFAIAGFLFGGILSATGAAIFWWHGRKAPAPATNAHDFWFEGCEPICAGLISGAALVGIGNAIVNVLLG